MMAEQKKPTGYFVGEVREETPQGTMMIPVIARPDGTAISGNEVLVEILNKLDELHKTIKQNL